MDAIIAELGVIGSTEPVRIVTVKRKLHMIKNGTEKSTEASA